MMTVTLVKNVQKYRYLSTVIDQVKLQIGQMKVCILRIEFGVVTEFSPENRLNAFKA